MENLQDQIISLEQQVFNLLLTLIYVLYQGIHKNCIYQLHDHCQSCTYEVDKFETCQWSLVICKFLKLVVE